MKSIMPNSRSLIAPILASLFLAALAGCGNYGGDSSGPDTSGGGGSTTSQENTTIGLSESEQLEAFTTTVYPVVRQNCAGGCHDTGARSAPFLFANRDESTAYTVITESQKVNLSAPDRSPVVRKLGSPEFHNCGNNCAAIQTEMLAAVMEWAGIIEESGGAAGEQVAVDAIASGVVAYTEGSPDENGERYEANLIAFYDFKTGGGGVVWDQSGVDPPINLQLSGSYEWMDSWGIVFNEGQATASKDNSSKLYSQIATPGVGTQQYTVELWINNENTTQEDARIISYSRFSNERAFSLEQQQYQYEFRQQSLAATSGLDGRESLITYDVDQDAQETLQHVVITHDLFRGRRIYVDSVFTGDEDPVDPARLWTWGTRNFLSLGANREGRGHWRGQIRMLAIYKEALSGEKIRKNFIAGVGKRIRLDFSLRDWTGNDAEVQFSVTSLDNNTYLFCQPTFVGSGINGMRVKNMRVQVNPADTSGPAAEGQGFTNLDVVLTGSRHQVSRGCSLVPRIDGPDQDKFTIVFEELSNFSDPEEDQVYEYEIDLATRPRPPDTGFRDFSRIRATLSSLTGVNPRLDRAVDPNNVETIQEIYETLEGQLPSTVDARAIVSSHQVGVTKLTFEYCVEMVDRPALREAVFGSEFETGNPSFFQSDVATAFADPILSDLLVERFVDHAFGVEQIDDQPLLSEIMDDLDQLRDQLTDPLQCGPCDAERTRSIAKGLCTAVAASAAVMLH